MFDYTQKFTKIIFLGRIIYFFKNRKLYVHIQNQKYTIS